MHAFAVALEDVSVMRTPSCEAWFWLSVLFYGCDDAAAWGEVAGDDPRATARRSGCVGILPRTRREHGLLLHLEEAARPNRLRCCRGASRQVLGSEAGDPIAPLPATCALIEVRLREGRSLLVAPGFDAIHLRRMLPWKNVVSCAGNSRRSCSTSCARSFLSERSSYFPGIP